MKASKPKKAWEVETKEGHLGLKAGIQSRVNWLQNKTTYWKHFISFLLMFSPLPHSLRSPIDTQNKHTTQTV